MAGCGKTPDSPKQQQARELKAAGVRTFVIECSKDLWERTSGATTYGDADNIDATKVDKGPGSTVTVTLSGPQMVEYLRALDFAAHGGRNDLGSPSQIDATLARRMYDAIAPVVDSVSRTPGPNRPPPVITVDDKSDKATFSQ